jgi:hypothetical protein
MMEARPQFNVWLRGGVPSVLAMVLALAVFLLSGDWLLGASIFVLWTVWRFVPTLNGPPVLEAALTFQWIEVVAGVYYHALTGRELTAIQLSEYRPMVSLGLVCIVALVLGIRGGFRLVERSQRAYCFSPGPGLEWHDLAIAYAAVVLSFGTIQSMAWQIPVLTQAILAVSFLRYGLLFLMFRRLLRPQIRWTWISVIVAVELGTGLTGYFATFREPLMILGVALLEVFDYRKVRNWIALGLLGSVALLTGLIWTGIKVDYRAEFADADFASSRALRSNRVISLASDWLSKNRDQHLADVDKFVDRMWPIYYPALALSRVPDPIPHADGEIMREAVIHILIPRILFPDKSLVRSDSELVRKYSGIPVDDQTSMAFGYAAEAYIDFGIPFMFVPVVVYGLLMGAAIRWLLKKIHSEELGVAIVTVIGWMSLYLFERTWIYMLGLSGVLVICLGGCGLLVDSLLRHREMSRTDRRAYVAFLPTTGGSALS